MTIEQTKCVRVAVLTSILLLSCALAAFACNPALATVCQRFERAEAVFVGKLTKAERKTEDGFITLSTTFTVLETYKGTVGPIETIKFGTGDCDPKVDQIGEIYFVYKEPYQRVRRVANYTHVLAKADGDLEFAKQVNSKKPIFRISAFLSGLDKADLPQARILISDGQREERVTIDRDGRFEYFTRRPGSYKVTIVLPKAASIGWEQLHAFSAIVEGTSFVYETSFRPNGCDVRQINISPK